MTHMPNAEELEALNKALAEALGELRVVRTERDLLKEQLNRFKRQLFEAKSEVGAAHQKDMFFNEAEAEGAQAQPAAEETDDDKIDVPAHRRAKRGRKPLDAALPREVVRHELPEGERVAQRLDQLAGEGVLRLGAVEGHGGDGAVSVDQEHGLHGRGA